MMECLPMIVPNQLINYILCTSVLVQDILQMLNHIPINLLLS